METEKNRMYSEIGIMPKVDIIQGIYSAMKMAKITKKSVQYKRQNRS
jgi:hypothetical protein